MMKYKIINLSKDIIFLENVNMANNFFTRLIGLLGKDNISEDEGIIIKPCNSIHTLGMKFTIDVAFIDRNHEVIYIINEMPKGKIGPIIKKSAFVIEARAGVFMRKGLDIGDRLEIIEWKL